MQSAERTSTGAFYWSDSMFRWFRKRLTDHRRKHDNSETRGTCSESESHAYEEIPDLIPTAGLGVELRVLGPQTDDVTNKATYQGGKSRLHQSTGFGAETTSASHQQNTPASGLGTGQARHPSHLCDRIQNCYVTMSYNAVKLKDTVDFLSSERHVDMTELSSGIKTSHKELQKLDHFRQTCVQLAFQDQGSRAEASVRNSTGTHRQNSFDNSSRHKRSKLQGYKSAISPSTLILSKPDVSLRRKEITAIYRADKSHSGEGIYRCDNRLLSDIIRLNNDRQMLAV